MRDLSSISHFAMRYLHNNEKKIDQAFDPLLLVCVFFSFISVLFIQLKPTFANEQPTVRSNNRRTTEAPLLQQQTKTKHCNIIVSLMNCK